MRLCEKNYFLFFCLMTNGKNVTLYYVSVLLIRTTAQYVRYDICSTIIPIIWTSIQMLSSYQVTGICFRCNTLISRESYSTDKDLKQDKNQISLRLTKFNYFLMLLKTGDWCSWRCIHVLFMSMSEWTSSKDSIELPRFSFTFKIFFKFSKHL